MWVLVLITTAAASYVPGIIPILQTNDQQTCLADRLQIIHTKAVNPDLVLCLSGNLRN